MERRPAADPKSLDDERTHVKFAKGTSASSGTISTFTFGVPRRVSPFDKGTSFHSSYRKTVMERRRHGCQRDCRETRYGQVQEKGGGGGDLFKRTSQQKSKE